MSSQKELPSITKEEALQDLDTIQNALSKSLKLRPNSKITEKKMGLVKELRRRLEGAPDDFPIQLNLRKLLPRRVHCRRSHEPIPCYDEKVKSWVSLENELTKAIESLKFNGDDNDSLNMENFNVSDSTTADSTNSLSSTSTMFTISTENDESLNKPSNRADKDQRSIDVTFIEKDTKNQSRSESQIEVPSSNKGTSSTDEEDCRKEIKGILSKPTYLDDNDVRGCRDMKPKQRTVKRDRSRRIKAVQFN